MNNNSGEKITKQRTMGRCEAQSFLGEKSLFLIDISLFYVTCEENKFYYLKKQKSSEKNKILLVKFQNARVGPIANFCLHPLFSRPCL